VIGPHVIVRVDIRDAIQQDQALVGVGLLAGEDVGIRKGRQHAADQAPLLPVEVGDEQKAVAFVIEVPVAVVNSIAAQRVVRVRVLGVVEQTAVGLLGVENASFVYAALVVRPEVIGREHRLA